MNTSTTTRTDWSFATTLLAIAAALLLTPFSSRAQVPAGIPMLLAAPAASDVARAAAKAKPAERGVARQRQVAVAFEYLDPPVGFAPTRLGVELFDGIVVVVDLARVERRSTGSFTWHGSVEGYDKGEAVLTVVDGAIAGTITLADSAARIFATYQLQTDRDGAQSLRQVDQSGFPTDHPAGSEKLRAPLQEKASSPDTRGSIDLKAGTTASADTGAIIDVMIVYSKQTAAAAGTAIAAQAQQAIDSANTAYANSGITTRLNLVHVAAMNYDESGDFHTDLNRLTSAGDGYMDEAHTLRNTYGADLVSLFIENGTYCGLAWIGPSAGYGFSVINRGCASGNLSFAHELGHNFGALHDPYVDPSTSPYAFGHGYAVPTAGWRTVMAYNNACSAASTSCTRIPYFSNPNLTYGTAALPLGTSAISDNARVHNQNAATVANFRSSGGSACTFALSPPSVSVAATAASGSTSVSAGTGCAWNAVSNAPSWLSIGAGSATSSTGTLNYAAAANTGPARSGAIAVGGVNFTVSQASGCSYVLSASSASFASTGGAGSFTLTTGTGCTWTASSGVAWLTITSAKSGSGSATVKYSVGANTSTSVQSANLSVGGQTFMVSVAAAATAPVTPAPVATLSATSVNFGNQKVGTTSAAKTVTLTNTGGGTLTIGSLIMSGANPDDFARAGTCMVDTALSANQSCSLLVAFTPAGVNSRSATLTVGVSSGTVKLALSGRGARK